MSDVDRRSSLITERYTTSLSGATAFLGNPDFAVEADRLPAWFKNARFRVTLGISARTLIGPALERVYASRSFLRWGLQLGENRCTPEVPASERAAHPSATPQDSCRLEWGLHCAGTGGGSGRTEANVK